MLNNLTRKRIVLSDNDRKKIRDHFAVQQNQKAATEKEKKEEVFHVQV